MKYWAGLYAEMDREELVEGATTMSSVAERLMVAQRKSEGGVKKQTEEERNRKMMICRDEETLRAWLGLGSYIRAFVTLFFVSFAV